MQAFTFQTVAHIQAGPVVALPDAAVERWRPARPLLVTDAGLRAAGLTEALWQALKAHGMAPALFDQVVADPPEQVVQAAAEAARAHGADLVIGFGGGSSLDTAKLVAVLAATAQPLAQMYGIGQLDGPRLPLVQVPTTAGTGSEVTPIAIVTTGETSKMGVVDPVLYADIAWLDAELTLGLPPAVTAATGIDAMVHAIEAYTSKHKKNPMSDACARQALQLLNGALLPACRDGADQAARADMLRGAMLAGQAFANAPVAAVHALAYPIGGIFHVPHGLSNALVLPHVLRFNLPEAAPLYADLAGLLAPTARGSDEAKAVGVIGHLVTLAEAAGVPARLREVGISHNDLPRLAEAAIAQTRLLVNNPRTVTEADALAIYEAAW